MIKIRFEGWYTEEEEEEEKKQVRGRNIDLFILTLM